MAASSSFQRAGERRGRWGSPERTVVWTEPKPKPMTRKVAVVYYLCLRDGHLDHPHFLEMELPTVYSSHSHHRTAPPGLYLRDFTARLNALRGSGMASLYSWSSKRSYRNGYVWQDLAEDDLIHPAQANDEYVLKGSPLLLLPQLLPPSSSSTTQRHHDDSSSDFSSHQDRRAGRRRKNWSSFDLGDRDYNNKLAAATQNAAGTDDSRGPEPEHLDADPSAELGIDEIEISPPPSSSSPDDPLQDSCSREVVGVIAGGRMRASAVLMQLFSCGSMATVKRPGHARRRSDLMISGSSRQQQDAADDASARAECLSGGAGVGTGSSMERDYFCGSLVESGKTSGGSAGNGALLLKRSSSCNADRGKLKLKLPVSAKEARAGCLASRAGRLSKKNMTRSTTTVAKTESKVDGGQCKGAMEPTTADEAGREQLARCQESRSIRVKHACRFACGWRDGHGTRLLARLLRDDCMGTSCHTSQLTVSLDLLLVVFDGGTNACNANL